LLGGKNIMKTFQEIHENLLFVMIVEFFLTSPYFASKIGYKKMSGIWSFTTIPYYARSFIN